MPEGYGYDEPTPKYSNPHKTEKTQIVATGGMAEVDQTKVEEEAAAFGVDLNPIGGHGQGGQGH